MNRLIISSNDSPKYLDFWHITCSSWNKFFPNIPISMAFVTEREECDELVARIRQRMDVRLFRNISGVPSGNLAKVARYLLASEFTNDVCISHDIDSIPLQHAYFSKLLANKKEGMLMGVGKEVYDKTEHAGKFPAGYFTAEGWLFKRLFNPNGLSNNDLFSEWKNIREFDHKESPYISPDTFSDESLIRALVKRNNMSDAMHYVDRGVDIGRDWIDRSWWRIDEDKLFKGGYTDCNMPRPILPNLDKMKSIIRFIYNGDIDYGGVI